MKEHLFKVERTARVYTFGQLSDKTTTIWVVAHGYGQLAKYFIKKFDHLDPEKNFVIAPEGLSRAYIDGMTGRVGASWMTKDLREEEIDEYLNCIELIFNELTKNKMPSNAKILALGFSQGGATISRWAVKTKCKVDLLVVWGGQPAAELFASDALNNHSIIFVIGDKDLFITSELRGKLLEQCKEKGWRYEVIDYQGAHHLQKQTISLLLEKL